MCLVPAGQQEVEDAGVVLAQELLLKLCVLCLHLRMLGLVSVPAATAAWARQRVCKGLCLAMQCMPRPVPELHACAVQQHGRLWLLATRSSRMLRVSIKVSVQREKEEIEGGGGEE